MIVKMRHLDLVCLASDKEATLASLRELGAVHLDLAGAQGAAVASALAVMPAISLCSCCFFSCNIGRKR